MGSFSKRVKKYANKALKVSTLGLVGGKKESSSGGEDAGMRSAAAKRMVNRNQQAGGGTINFNTEEYT